MAVAERDGSASAVRAARAKRDADEAAAQRAAAMEKAAARLAAPQAVRPPPKYGAPPTVTASGRPRLTLKMAAIKVQAAIRGSASRAQLRRDGILTRSPSLVAKHAGASRSPSPLKPLDSMGRSSFSAAVEAHSSPQGARPPSAGAAVDDYTRDENGWEAMRSSLEGLDSAIRAVTPSKFDQLARKSPSPTRKRGGSRPTSAPRKGKGSPLPAAPAYRPSPPLKRAAAAPPPLSSSDRAAAAAAAAADAGSLLSDLAGARRAAGGAASPPPAKPAKAAAPTRVQPANRHSRAAPKLTRKEREQAAAASGGSLLDDLADARRLAAEASAAADARIVASDRANRTADARTARGRAAIAAAAARPPPAAASPAAGTPSATEANHSMTWLTRADEASRRPPKLRPAEARPTRRLRTTMTATSSETSAAPAPARRPRRRTLLLSRRRWPTSTRRSPPWRARDRRTRHRSRRRRSDCSGRRAASPRTLCLLWARSRRAAPRIVAAATRIATCLRCPRSTRSPSPLVRSRLAERRRA